MEEDLQKEFEYYTKLISDFKEKQHSSGESSTETKSKKPKYVPPSSVSARNNSKYIKNTKYSLRKARPDHNCQNVQTDTHKSTTDNTQTSQGSVNNYKNQCNEPVYSNHSPSKQTLGSRTSHQPSANPYKYVKNREAKSASCNSNFENDTKLNTFSDNNTFQLSTPSLSSSTVGKQDGTDTYRQKKLCDVSSMLSKLNSIEVDLHNKTDSQLSLTDEHIAKVRQVKNGSLGSSQSPVLSTQISENNIYKLDKEQYPEDYKAGGVLNILPSRNSVKTSNQGNQAMGTSLEKNKFLILTKYRCGSTPIPVSLLGKSDSFSDPVVKKSRFKLVKHKTTPQCWQPVNSKGIKHYGLHKMVRKQARSTSSEDILTKGESSGFMYSTGSVVQVPNRKIVTKHKLVKLPQHSTDKPRRSLTQSSSRLKTWNQLSVSKISYSGIVAQKLVKSYQRKSLVRSRYKLVRQGTASDGKKSLHNHHKHGRPQTTSHHSHNKLTLSSDGTSISRSPRKSKYSIVKSRTDFTDDTFNINSALGRTVENLSQNKYKFIKPKHSAESKRSQTRRSRLKIDRRVGHKSPRRKSGSSYVILRGHVYKKAKHGIVKVGRSSSGLDNKKKVSRKIPDAYRNKNSALKTARHMVVRSIATVVQNKFKRDHRQTDSPRKQHKYCLYYNRFGKCSRGGSCSFIHDPEKVAVCTRFIRGTCQVTDCPFSHKVTKEKMPVCRYFMKGSCVHDQCPYLHVNVGKNAQVCEDFLHGYCSAGEKCKKKHTLICPDNETRGQCPRGNSCKMKHVKRTTKRKVDVVVRPPLNKEEESVVTSKRPRVPVVSDVPEQEDDITLPMKDRHLPAYISIRSPEEKTGDSHNVLVKRQAESVGNITGNENMAERLVHSEPIGTVPGLQIRPNLREEKLAE